MVCAQIDSNRFVAYWRKTQRFVAFPLVLYSQLKPRQRGAKRNGSSRFPAGASPRLLEPVGAKVEVGVARAHGHRCTVEVVAVGWGVCADGKKAAGLWVLLFGKLQSPNILPHTLSLSVGGQHNPLVLSLYC